MENRIRPDDGRSASLGAMTLPTTRPTTRPRGRILAAAAVLVGLVLLLHGWIPNQRFSIGSLVETGLPWLGVLVPLLAVGALARRSVVAGVALLVPVAVWLGMFGGLLLDGARTGDGLTAVSHNVGADNPDPAGTARDLAASGADLLALQELTPRSRPTYEQELAADYPYRAVLGSVGLWSRLPLAEPEPVDVALDFTGTTRALRTSVTTDDGPLAVYVAHLGSVRIFPINGFWTESRNAGIDSISARLAADPSPRVLLLGDLNGSLDDRAFAPLTAQLSPVRAGGGFGFTWPASFPVVRSDQVLARGLDPLRSWTLPATGSDHLPVAAAVGW
jgi:vancomycin resistance protein VanJ